MNKWKVAFFALAGTVLFAILLVVFLATRPVDGVDVKVKAKEMYSWCKPQQRN